MNIAIVGDTFTDEYIYGNIKRLSPEAPVPILLPDRKEIRAGGAANVANNLFNLGADVTLFSITSLDLPFKVVSPSDCTDLIIKRYITNIYTLLRVDSPESYLKKDLERMIYPMEKEFDIIAFIDYGMGIITGGKATIVDSIRHDLSMFEGTEYLTINKLEYDNAEGKEIFPQAFVTKGSEGIDYYKYGKFNIDQPTKKIKVVDTIGAGDTVTATIIYCLANGISNPVEIMKLANKAAGVVISKFGTTPINKEELR